MPLNVATDAVRPPVGIYCSIEPNAAGPKEAYSRILQEWHQAVLQSAFLTSRARFDDAWLRLNAAALLRHGWDSYAADPPNDKAYGLALTVLDELEVSHLPPTRLMPSVEGGIGLSFVEGDDRAYLELCNTGEIIVAIYQAQGEPEVWELDITQVSLRAAINRIRVHLAD
jgi:hypothetical protein